MHDRTRNCRARRGNTLPELMLSLGILTLLLAAVVVVFILMLRLTGSVIGASLSSTDASNAMQRITMDLREADHFSLLDDATHDAVDKNGHTVVTGITITGPTPYVSPLSANGSVYYTTGANVSNGPLTGANVPYKIGSPSAAAVSFYRADWHQSNGTDGTPDPTAGNCLWVTGTENGVAITPGPVIKTIAPTADAVQFIVPTQADGVTPIANEAQIKIISGQYDPIHGTDSSDSAAGGATALTGDCVYLRDHNPTPTAAGGANGKRFYFGG